MITHINENLKDYLVNQYLNSSKNGCTDLYDVIQKPGEKEYIIGDKISQIRNHLSTWTNAKIHVTTYNIS